LNQGLLAVARATCTRGFLPDDEGMALYRAGLLGATVGPLLEIGAWRGKSAVYLGAAAAESGTVLFSVATTAAPRSFSPGGSTTIQVWSTAAPGGSTPSRSSAAPSRKPAWKRL
jgi:hypothetical protein